MFVETPNLMQNTPTFTINFPCKSYVRRYVDQNFGSPADFRKDKELNTLFRNKLKRKLFHYDTKLQFGHYTQNIDIIISNDDFYRYGWELSKSDITEINNILECRVKAVARTYISVNKSLGFSISSIIDNFQTIFDFPEDVWAKESIIKDFQRNGSREELNVESFSVKINNILLNNMLKRSAISKSGKIIYENRMAQKQQNQDTFGDNVAIQDTLKNSLYYEKTLF